MSERNKTPSHCDPKDLFVLVYEELRRLAYQKMARETPGHTLQPTALVHEAYLRLAKSADVHWENRRHFFTAAAEAMHRILIERARKQATLKRGAGWRRVVLDEATPGCEDCSMDIIEVGDALKRFEALSPRACHVIRLRYLAGLEIGEIAEVLEVSRRTVDKDIVAGKAWLRDHMATRGPS